jgi:predicted amidohydrolase
MGFDPLGKVVADCGTAEGIAMSDPPLDRTLVQKTRERFPFLKERKHMGW